MRLAALLMLFLVVFGAIGACGVKGKPLPPLADTPEEEDRLEEGRAGPSPTPSPSPSPSPQTKKKRKSQ